MITLSVNYPDRHRYQFNPYPKENKMNKLLEKVENAIVTLSGQVKLAIQNKNQSTWLADLASTIFSTQVRPLF